MKVPFPGHCFAQWFQGPARVAALALDPVATVAELRRIANSHASAYAEGTFGLFPEVIDGEAIWHVVEGPWSAATCLAAIDRSARVGAIGDCFVLHTTSPSSSLVEKTQFPGHCFVRWFQGPARVAARALGPIATVAELRRVANSHASPYAQGTFGLFPEVVDGEAVWHVIEGPWSAATCLASIDKSARVGAVGDSAGTAQDISRQAHEVAEKVEYVATETAPPAAVLRRRFYFSFTLGGGAGEPISYNLFPNSIPRVVSVAKLFESVRLIDASVEIVIEASLTARVGVGLNVVNSHARDIGHVRKMAHNMIAYGKSDAPKASIWDLPKRMTFGREYKMPSVGNGPAYISFIYAGGTSEYAEINGFLELEFAGEGVTLPLRIQPSDQTTGYGGGRGAVGVSDSSRANPGRVRMPARPVEDETDDDAEDEDE